MEQFTGCCPDSERLISHGARAEDVALVQQWRCFSGPFGRA
jgi:hypothetical protein